MQFAQHGTRAMCVLSANGAVSNVMLRQDSSSGGTVTYEVLARGIGLYETIFRNVNKGFPAFLLIFLLRCLRIQGKDISCIQECRIYKYSISLL